MLFTSNIFLFLFLPIVLLGYYLLHRPYRNTFLFLMSLLFYAWGEPKFVFIMIFSICFNYSMALIIDKWRFNNRIRCGGMGFTVVVNIGILFIYKYLGFFTANLKNLGLNIDIIEIILPIGISFFTFQALSYVIDVYRADVQVQKNILNFGLYISFFPQLIAGPIVRYQTIEFQIRNRRESFDLFGQGIYRFIVGFSKKMLLANNMALVADRAFELPSSELSMGHAWIGAIAYAFQIYFDFSGYSDMAIGLGRMFGFEFLENFNYPYLARSASEFWRRWHISLGSWFRDYVYFPLGGSRVKRKRLIFNLLVVWTLTGLWHGASWNFVVWGFLYAFVLIFEKLSGYPQNFKHHYSKGIYCCLTLLIILCGWVIFRADGLMPAVAYLSSMAGITDAKVSNGQVIYAIREYWFFFLVSFICSTDLLKKAAGKIRLKSQLTKIIYESTRIVFYLFCFIWSLSYIILGSHNPFVYFNF